MGSVKRAFLYVTRKRGKSILLFFILLIMATFVLTGLSIQKASQAAQKNLRQALGGEFQIIPDYSESNPYFKLDSDGEGNMTISTDLPVTMEVIAAILNVNGIKDYSALTQTLVSSTLDFIPGNVPLKAEYKNLVYANIVAETQNNDLFRSGAIKLTEGRHIAANDRNVAVISKDLADKNGLKSGDLITLAGSGTADVKIIGIYEVVEPDPPFKNIPTYERKENQIFTDLGAQHNLNPGETAGFADVTFTVEDPAELDSIISQVKALSAIDWKAFIINTDNQAYMEAVTPLQKLQALVTAVIAVIAVVSAVILSLILTMWGRSRVHETGVLLSLGIGKMKIINQYLAEVMMIAVIAFGFSYVTSNLIADQLANGLLQQNAVEEVGQGADTEMNTQLKNGADDSIAVRKKDSVPEAPDLPSQQENSLKTQPAMESVIDTDQLTVKIGFLNMLQLYLIGFFIISFSVGISSASVMRSKPKEILTKMS